MPGSIFISYRRGESLVEARALYERLSHDFAARVFIDLEGIDVGDEFAESLQRQLGGCAAMLVLIGPHWTGHISAGGARAIDDPGDYVHIELSAALRRGIRIVPVLLNGAELPAAAELPEALRPLLRRQALALDFHRFDADAGRLSHALQRILDGNAAMVPPPQRRGALPAAGAAALALVAAIWLVFGRNERGTTATAPGPALAPPRPALTGAATSPATRLRPAAPASQPALASGARLRDCVGESCPWLRVLAPGSFDMGSPGAEAGRADNEGPVRTVNLTQRLAVMESELTRRQFAAFVRASGFAAGKGCWHWSGSKDVFDAQRDWRSPGFEQTDDHPVVCVSWGDAQAFARWLSQLTGKTYRLPSEAEWEYAARAGSATRYSFGEREQDLCAFGNVLDLTAKAQYKAFGAKWVHADCTDGAVFTVPVARFKPNAFNLYGMHGNVWEWVQDCWHEGYHGAPGDAAAWQQGCDSERRVRRGGGWRSAPAFARSAFRATNPPEARLDNLGFRLVRELDAAGR